MSPSDSIPALQERLTHFCHKWEVSELAVFGSALCDDFRPDSDVDLLVSFVPTARHTLFDLVTMENELETLLGREVDLVERRSIEKSANYLRRRSILRDARVIYAQR